MSTQLPSAVELARQARDGMVEFLHHELIGPDPQPSYTAPDGQEILRPQDPPRMRYGAGVLFPRRCEVASGDSPSDDSTTAIAGADSGPPEDDGDSAKEASNSRQPSGAGHDMDSQTDGEVNRANDYLPSAMGLSVLLRLDDPNTISGRIRVLVSAGRYEQRTVPNIGRKSRKKDAEGNWQEGDWQPHWWRIPVEQEEMLDVSALFTAGRASICKLPICTHGEATPRLHVHVFSRQHTQTDEPERERIVTFTLVNDHPPIAGRAADKDCFFQCSLSVECSGSGISFDEYPERVTSPDGEDDEEASLDLLYRHRKTYAIGHGCAADWEAGSKAWTATLPTYEIRPIVAAGLKKSDGQEVVLSMQTLSEETGEAPLILCHELADAYRRWIEDRANDAAQLPEACRSAAERHLEGCFDCLDRIERGIVLLEDDHDTRTAFAWMNRAMLMQQLHYALVSNHRRSWVAEDEGEMPPPESLEAASPRQTRLSRNRRSRARPREGRRSLHLDAVYQQPDYQNPGKGKGVWRPFQLAFILMNLEGMVHPESCSEERKLVDLVWFPTGGGKTEAYLGLTSFTIFRRRLRDHLHAGVTVLMRYTLRLLTTQQFQRASSLICACEKIRREHSTRLGSIPISIGMWVGGEVTPIYHTDAAAKLAKMERGEDINPFVMLACPWCGAQMGAVSTGTGSAEVKGYHRAATAAGGVYFACDDPDCEFNGPHGGLPLHIVDEAVYEHQPTLVIGTVDKFALLPWRPEARSLFGLNNAGMIPPPELIIQDELHLISGALGSMVGHYEGALEEFCTLTRPDGRRIPPKIVASTATIRRAGDQVRALYGGRDVFLFPPQGLQAGASFFAREDNDKAAGRCYVGVFASALSSHTTAQIRVLSALLQGVRSLAVTDSAALDPYTTLMVYFNSLRELGHAATMVRADIREYMNALWDRLDIQRPPENSGQRDRRRFIHRDRELTSRIDSRRVGAALDELFVSQKKDANAQVIDLCLATNMIQVGLDVPRLGLMAVVGQPKTTSEYIQATSRVGRDIEGPGLVVTIYNPGRPRDRSHYEHFRSYHESIYRWVEPTSVTPFAVPVRERALHAQIIALARFWGHSSLRQHPQPAPDDTLLARIREALLERVRAVDPGEEIATARHFDNLAGDWRRVPPSQYGGFGYRDEPTPLMYPSGSTPRPEWSDHSMSTPTSMRNVDQECCAEPVSRFVQES